MTLNTQPSPGGSPAQTTPANASAFEEERTSPPTSETPSPQPELQPAEMTEAQKADAVAALFETPQPEGQPEAQPEAPAPQPEGQPEAVDLAAVAESLGVEPADLYRVQVPVGEGQTVSLGELKDAYRAASAAEQDLVHRRNQVDRRELELVQEGHLMANVLAALGPQLTPQLAQYIENYDRQVDAQERLSLGRLVPAIADKTSRMQFIERAVGHMARVTGRSENECAMRLGLLRGRGSALDVQFLHAAVEAMDELDRLKGVRTAAEKHEAPKTKRSGGQPVRGAPRNFTSDSDRAVAIGQLINGG